MKILVVEDDEVTRNLLEMIVENQCHETISAAPTWAPATRFD